MRIVLVFIILFTFACEKKEEATPTGELDQVKEEPKAEVAEKKEVNDVPESAAKKPAAMPEDMKPGEKKAFGGKFTIEGDAVTLASAMEKPSEAPVKVSGTINKVCKKKGCWFTLSGPDVKEEVRVRMKDYGFFVPKNADGGAVVAEGVLKQREIPQDEAQHYEDDAAKEGETPKKVEGPQKTFEFTATAVEIELNS